MIIDIHVHPVARSMVEDKRNLAFMAKHAAKNIFGETPIETLLSRMDDGGIHKSCLLGPNGYDGIALTNEAVRQAVDAHRDRFIGFLGVDPDREGETATRAQIETAVNDWGFKGVGEFGGCDFLSPVWNSVYEPCVKYGIPVLVHTGIPLPSMLMKYCGPAMIDELAARYPDLRIIAAHAGIPWIMETIAVAMRHRNVYIDLSALPGARIEIVPFVVALAVDRGLEDRICFGSDFPVVDPSTYAKYIKGMSILPPLRWITGLPRITSDIKAKVLGKNVAKLLGAE